MEEEDEVVKPLDPSQLPQSEPQPDVSDQCDAVSVAGTSPEAAIEEEAKPEPIVESREELSGERDEEVSNVEESEPEAKERILEDEVAQVEEVNIAGDDNEIAKVEEEVELAKVEVAVREGRDDVDDESVKAEELAPVVTEGLEAKSQVSGEVRDELETKNEEAHEVHEELEAESEETGEDEKVEVQELRPVSEEVEVKTEEAVAGEEREVEGDEVMKEQEPPRVAEGAEGAVDEEREVEGDEVMKEEEPPRVAEVAGDEEMEGEKEGNGGEGGQLMVEEEEGEGEDEEAKGEEGEADEMYDSPIAAKDEELAEDEETTPEMETETDAVKSSSGGGKRKRGRNAKAAQVRAPARKIVGEDVCFICLDGGDLVLCDRRGCPKAYHPSCVDHDDEFFKTKGRWNCGWHLCNKCGKNAYFMCYTCQFSLCKGCCKDAVVFCVRGNKGFCESCMKTVKMIENSEQNEMDSVAFDDKSSWEYLFKDYWIEQKRKLGITSDELARAKNPWKSSDATDKQQTSIELQEGSDDEGTDSDSSIGHLEATDSKKRKAKRKSKPVDSDTDSEKDAGTAKRKGKRRSRSQTKETYSDSEKSSGNEDTSNKRGKRPKRLLKSRSKSGKSSSAVTVVKEGHEWASNELLEFVMHMKDGDKSVLTQFDVQGLLLEYIKMNKLRDPRRQSQIICDSMLQKLFGKPRVGHFEMLKLLESHFLLKDDPHADDNHGSVADDISQLDPDDDNDFIHDAGRNKGRKSRKRGEDKGLPSNLDDYAAIDMHNIGLIYLRRNLMEALMANPEAFHEKVVGSFVRIRISGSNQKQDIYRLVQIIGTSKAAEPYKVGKRTTEVMLEILNLDKTEIMSIDTISNQEFTEDECKRLRQSIKCGLISRMTVGDVLEKARELQEVRVTDWLEAETLRLSHLRDRASDMGRKKQLRECVEKLQLLKTPEERQRRLEKIPEVHADPKMDPSYESEDESEKDNKRRASNIRPRDSGFSRRGREQFASRRGGSASNDSWSANSRSPNRNWELNRSSSGKGFSTRREDTSLASQTSDHTWNNGVDKGTSQSNSWEKPRPTSDPSSTGAEYPGVRSDTSAVNPPESSLPLSVQIDSKVSETDKMWNYRDPTGKVQGPFSIAQLRKWSNTGYFPADLRIWKTSQTEDDSILLTEALAGRFQKESPSVGLPSDVGQKIRHESSNLPSPTPALSSPAWGVKQTSESKWSNTASPFRTSKQFQGGSERLPSPTPTSPSSSRSGVDRSNFSQLPTVQPSSVINPTIRQSGATLNSGALNPQQIPSHQAAPNVANQAFAQQNVAQQNPSVYAHGWTSGHNVARPEMVNANMIPNNSPNTVPQQQLPYGGQWTAAPVNNQLPYANVAPNMPNMPSQNPWRPAPTNMQWGGQQPPPVNPNMGWTAAPSPAGAVAGPMGQLAGPTPAMGWPGAGPNPSTGGANPGWVAPPGNTGAWAGDQNRNGGAGQWNRQSSFGSGGQRVCKFFQENGHCRKGASCDYMHT